MFQISVLNRVPLAFTFEVRLCEMSSTLFECDIVSITQQRPPGNRSDGMQRTDTGAAARVQDGVRALVRVTALHVDEWQLDCPALRMLAIFRYDQKPTPDLVEAVGLIDTVTRFDARNITLLCSGGKSRYKKQTEKKESDHCFLLCPPGGVDHLGPHMHNSAQLNIVRQKGRSLRQKRVIR